MRKKVLIFLLGALLTGSAACMAQETETVSEAVTAAAAEEFTAPVYDYDSLTVGTTNPFSGAFFTSMWGNVSSDLDVRSLIHGYDLVEWDSEKSIFRTDPSVVSSVVVTEDQEGNRTYLLALYDDLTYNDGTPITAKDYAFSTLLSIAPEAEQIGGSLKNLEYLVGYDDYVSGRSSSLAGVRVQSDNLISFTVSHEYLPFFYEMALLDCTPYPISVIAPGCVVKDDGNGIYIANEDETITEPVFTAELLETTILDPETGYLSHPSVTSGPYSLVSFDGDKVELTVNEAYKGNSDGIKPEIASLTFKEVNNDTMVDEFASGDVGLLNKCVSMNALLEAMKLVQSHPDVYTMSNYPRTGLSFMSFCCEKDTVSDAAVRQAIAMCLDKDALVKEYVSNFGARVDGYYGLGQWMNMIVSGTMPYPVDEPEEDAGEDAAAEYGKTLEEWKSLSLDNMKVYDLDTDGAVALLESAGWTLDRQGDAFDPSEDDVRCKEIDGQIVPLDLTMLVPEGNRIADVMEEAFIANLKEAGILLTVQILPMEELLREYYYQDERSCDMIYLASNFDIVYDPSQNFRPVSDEDASGQNTHNTTRINDEQLYQLAADMRKTEPGDTLSYMKKWIAFEERFAEVLPVIPVYSNVYFDFYPKVLQNYQISSFVSWGNAIVEAYMSDPADEEEPLTE